MQRVGLWSSLNVPEPPPVTSDGGWESPLLWDAPTGWQGWAKVYVPPVGTGGTGYDTVAKSSSSTEPNYPCLEIRPPVVNKVTQRNFVVVMPRPGDKKGHTGYRKGAVYLNGGDNVVFATERPDGTLRRGGFVIEMPRFQPYPTPYPYDSTRGAAGKSYVHDDMKQTLVLSDDASVSSTAIVDISGYYIRGSQNDNLDAGEGTTGGTRRIVQLQRYRCEDIHARCGADEAGKSGNPVTTTNATTGVTTTTYPHQPGYVTDSGYAKLTTWTHCDGFQVWKEGLGELRMHDVTIKSGFGGLMMPTGAGSLQGLTTPAQTFGDLYLSRVNLRSNNNPYPETGTGTGNYDADYPSTYKYHDGNTPLFTSSSALNAVIMRTALQMGTARQNATVGGVSKSLAKCNPKHLYTHERDDGVGTVYIMRPINNRGITSMLEPNDSGDIDTSNYTSANWNTENTSTVTDADDDYISYTANVRGNQFTDRFHQKWNGKFGSAKVTDPNTAGKLMLGLPLITLADNSKVRRDYAPASKWGSSPLWNEYEE